MSTPRAVDLVERKAEYRIKMLTAKTTKEGAKYKRLFRNVRNQIESGRRK